MKARKWHAPQSNFGRSSFLARIDGNPALLVRGGRHIGVTSDLIKRIFQHKQGLVAGFTQKYKLYKLLYYEVFDSIEEAIKREKQLKNWHREWKLNLIKSKNLTFKDLYPEIIRS